MTLPTLKAARTQFALRDTQSDSSKAVTPHYIRLYTPSEAQGFALRSVMVSHHRAATLVTPQ